MPRSLRVDYENAWHHVINRGVARQSIFPIDADRKLLLDLLVRAFLPHGVELHGYCLMSNHYHLLVRSRQGHLAKAMAWFSARYTQTINYRDNRDGPLFRGRFTSVELKSDGHLANVSRYVHLNPVDAGLVPTPDLWPWSSARFYIGDSPAPDWLVVDEILAMFSPAAPRESYRAFLNEGIDNETRRIYAELSR
jgi:putative transposase